MQSVYKGIEQDMRARVLILAILAMMMSCASQKKITEKQEIRRDNTEVVTKTIYDTLHITLRDTIHERVQKQEESHTQIVLGEGGSYNTKTGEVRGAKEIWLSSTLQEQREKDEILMQDIERALRARDSLRSEIKEREKSKSQQRESKNKNIALPLILLASAMIVCIIGKRYNKG